MIQLTIKNLLQERTRLAISLGGVALALFLVLLLEGIFEGTSEQLVAYPEESKADVWVMQSGVSNMHMATSVLPARLKGAIDDVPDVESVSPIIYANVPVRTGAKRWPSYVVGVQPGSEQGGPWDMKEGSPGPKAGEAVISDLMASKSGLVLGDELEILGRKLRIAGLSRGTFSMANTITFVSYEDMEALLGVPGTASYLLVKGRPGISANVLAESIRRSVSGVNVMTREEFVASDLSMSRQMGAEVIQVMSLIGFVVGVLVIGLTMYTATVRRSREYGIAKALGVRDRQLLAAVGFQSVIVALLGLGLAIAVAYLFRPLVNAFVPEVPLVYPAASLVKLGLSALGIAFLASLLPAYRISRVEPAVVFKE
ncbi:MAG: FtsX-like permease family protein [Chloroflexi bacterium]|nr:FtsX-like permease family protein [Chloroflexota bacterium]